MVDAKMAERISITPLGLASHTGFGVGNPTDFRTKLISPRLEYIQRKMIEMTTDELIRRKIERRAEKGAAANLAIGQHREHKSSRRLHGHDDKRVPGRVPECVPKVRVMHQGAVIAESDPGASGCDELPFEEADKDCVEHRSEDEGDVN